jgi:hypothetical protein
MRFACRILRVAQGYVEIAYDVERRSVAEYQRGTISENE